MRNGDQYLSVPVQHFATYKGFTQYKPIQLLAFQFNQETEDDLILMAETGAGKTEAATFSICSKVDFTKPGVRVLYISPYCSLINDQTERFEEMGAFEELDFRVTKWHKDAKQSLKNSLVRRPEGILLITPESIEAMFQHHPENVKRLFSSLDYVVVDEIHEFCGGKPRGVHLKNLLFRLEAFCEKPFRFIGLSATIGGDPAEVKNFLGRPEKTKLLRDKSIRETELTVDYYPAEDAAPASDECDYEESDKELKNGDGELPHQEPGPVENETVAEEKETASGKPDNEMVKLPGELLNTLKEMTEGKNSLVFANSKPMVEEIAVVLKGLILDENTFSHTAAVSKDTREDIEHMAKYGLVSPYRICCTTTMEHGIDFPTLDQICQIDSTSSVSSLIQRAGRSGRRGGKAVIHIFCTEEWNMIQSIACCNLLKTNTIEAPDKNVQLWNVLLMQILSVVRAHQMSDSSDEELLTIDKIVEGISKSFAFGFSSEEDIKAIIEHCLKTDLLKEFEGDIIIGDAGLPLVGKMNSYTSFQTPVEYVVKCLDLPKPIGTLPTDAKVSEGKCFFLSARIWEVTGIDEMKNVIYVKEAAKGKKPSFFSNPAPVSREVEQEMQHICMSDDQYPFISDKCTPVLEEKRVQFAEFKTMGALNTPYFTNSANLFCFFPFQGTRIFNTLKLLLDAESEEYSLKVNKSVTEFLAQCKGILASPPDIEPILMEQLENGEVTPAEKLEKYLPVEYQAKLEASIRYDMEGALLFLRSLIEGQNIPDIPDGEWVGPAQTNNERIQESDNMQRQTAAESNSVMLEGNIYLHCIMVSEGTFPEEIMAQTLQANSEALEWIQEKAAPFGHNVKFVVGPHEIKEDIVQCPIPNDYDNEGAATANIVDYLAQSNHQTIEDIAQLAKEKGCSKYAIVAFINAPGRSFALFNNSEPYLGNAFIFCTDNNHSFYLPSGVIAHEVLHFFGAEDLYEDKDVLNTEAAKKARSEWPDDVMVNSLDDVETREINPITAEKIGLTKDVNETEEKNISNCER